MSTRTVLNAEEAAKYVGERVRFEFSISLDDLIECCGMSNLNSYMDEKFGDGCILADLSYEMVSLQGGSEVRMAVTGIVDSY